MLRSLAPTLATVATASVMLASVAAHAAPIVTSASAVLTVRSIEFGSIQVTGSGSITVDVAANTLEIPAGLITQAGTIVVPVTSSNAIAELSATGIQNLAGTFTLGGGTSQVAGETCPTGGPALGVACVNGGSLGGVMGLAGLIRFVVIPNVAAYPMTLSQVRLGLGGATTVTIGPADAAPWTLGTGQVAFTSNFTTIQNTGTSLATAFGTGSLAAGQLQLVTPTYVSLLGRAVPVIATLDLSFAVPEASGALLIGVGLLGLAGLSRVRR